MAFREIDIIYQVLKNANIKELKYFKFLPRDDNLDNCIAIDNQLCIESGNMIIYLRELTDNLFNITTFEMADPNCFQDLIKTIREFLFKPK